MSKLLNGHIQEESAATLLDAASEHAPNKDAPELSPPLSSFITEGDPSLIPPEHPYRTLVLCFDGTGDQFDEDNSNIVQLFTLLKKDDEDVQMVYYQAGIGTYTSPNIATPLMAKLSKTLDEMVAWNLDRHVMDGYEFLMQNCRQSRGYICIFGFSRGAYTARALAGVIHKVGLLPACNHQQVPFAYKMFKRADEMGWKQSNAFKKAFSVDVDIEFIGVWDTVSSVGLIPRKLPFTTSNTIVRTFRHAIALDEHRAKFQANHWNRPNLKEETLGVSDRHLKAHKKHHHSTTPRLKALERNDTDVFPYQVWFAGCHRDIGGGSVNNDTQHSLARIPLRWMIREYFRTNTGIISDCEGLQALGLDPGVLYPEVLPQDHDMHDLVSPIYDQRSLAPSWWLLEIWPMQDRHQKSDDSWASRLRFNLGRGRKTPKQKRGVLVHKGVKMRMEALHSNGTKYVPKALEFEQVVQAGNVQWVD
ncbi:hypothetical protein BDN71DRAFT_1483827 [Pleurotus eryngii]|uniref:T6SS Phospholipase effector Tle1-like catalytic domain-containing protein n=1 Tax=Pleurotus eryngii TaxID=5323 RepID=A0A9P5ZPX2_PLEER|nr:hypothetical protein BDN71DRAFT_1483827 [Pleurotus eryngii]